jgi:hypothetical protein
MNFMSLDQMMTEANIANQIADGTVDDSAYNVVTRSVNESALMDVREEVESILESKSFMRGEVDLIALAESVNSSLGKSGKDAFQKSVGGKSNEGNRVTENTAGEKKAKAGAAKAKGELAPAKQEVPGPKLPAAKSVVKAAEPTVVKTPVASKEAFQKAVGGKSNEGTRVTEDTAGEKKAKAGVKKEITKLPKQKLPKDFKEKAAKFEGYLDSVKTPANAAIVEGIREAFEITAGKMILEAMNPAQNAHYDQYARPREERDAAIHDLQVEIAQKLQAVYKETRQMVADLSKRLNDGKIWNAGLNSFIYELDDLANKKIYTMRDKLLENNKHTPEEKASYQAAYPSTQAPAPVGQ